MGALFLVAGAVLGMGAGRALPSVLTPPALAMAAFAFTALMHMSLGRTRTTMADGLTNSEPNRVSLLSPEVEEVRNVFVTLAASVHLGQTIWLLGMAATGFALLVAATPRTRLVALTPVLAGAALALLVLPSDPRRMYVVDEAAAAPVCDGPVCVTRTHQQRLADLAGPGKEALRLLHDALGGRAPASLRENTALLPYGATPKWSRETVFFDFDDDIIAAAQDKELTRALVAKGLVPGCSPPAGAARAATTPRRSSRRPGSSGTSSRSATPAPFRVRSSPWPARRGRNSRRCHGPNSSRGSTPCTPPRSPARATRSTC